MYQRILVGVDGSAASQRGLEEAVRLAAQGGAQLRIVHVLGELALMAGVPEAAYLEAVLAEARRRGEQVVANARASAAAAGVAAEAELVETVGRTIGDVLADEVARWRADLVVLGTHGRRGLRRMVLGSDAESVVRTSPVPVLLVRAPA
jgi:nucleotide-binding universal stress UspA family protein